MSLCRSDGEEKWTGMMSNLWPERKSLSLSVAFSGAVIRSVVERNRKATNFRTSSSVKANPEECDGRHWPLNNCPESQLNCLKFASCWLDTVCSRDCFAILISRARLKVFCSHGPWPEKRRGRWRRQRHSATGMYCHFNCGQFNETLCENHRLAFGRMTD